MQPQAFPPPKYQPTPSQVQGIAVYKPAPETEALNITRQLCDVLTYLHDQTPPVIFRDLKPGNIMLTHQGQVKLIDFGIARFFKPGQTQDTVFLGTPGYAAPEQYGGLGQSDPRTDVYSLGVVLTHMATGYDPTKATSPFPLPPVERLPHRVPPHVAQAITYATQLQPEQRYPDVMSLCRALDAPTANAVASDATGRKPWWIIGGAVALVAVLVICVILSPLSFAFNDRTPTTGLTATEIATDAPPETQPPEADVQATVTLKPTMTPTPGSTPSDTPEPTSTPTPAFRSEGEISQQARLAFVRVDQDTNRDGHVNFDDRRLIYVMSADGRDVRPLHDDARFQSYHSPSWSPDGTELVFAGKRSGAWELYLINADGSNLRALNLPVTNNQGPAWSPNGRYIAFYSGQTNDEDIYVLDLERNTVARLTDAVDSDKYPAWSPGSDQLAFYSERDGNQEIYLMDRDGSDQTRLTRHGGADYWPVWSPDGNRIAFASDRYGTCQEICLLDVRTREVQRLTYSNRHATSPSWAPDGDAIFFVRWEGSGYDNCDIYRIDINGRHETALTSRVGLHTKPVMWAP